MNLAFFGLDRTADGERRIAAVVYVFDRDTYREDDRKREMLYFPELRESGFHVRITLDKARGIWSVEKYRGDEWIGGGGGATFEGAMFHASQAGLDPGEAEATGGSSGLGKED